MRSRTKKTLGKDKWAEKKDAIFYLYIEQLVRISVVSSSRFIARRNSDEERKMER